MKYIISLDGGGTKTEAVAYDLQGIELSRGYSGFSNLLINEQEGINHIIEAIENCIRPLSKEDCIFIFLGLAGYGGIKDKNHIEKALNEAFQIPFKIVNDARLAHAALLNGENGVLTIAGTGSVCIGLKQDQVMTTGGWGHLLGDEGSGYWICIEMFKRITREYDEGLPLNYLSKKILEKLQLKEVDELKQYIYHATKGEIASHVPFIVENARMGDLTALDILEKAGQLLAKTTIQAIKKLGLENKPLVAIKGSILQQVPLVQNAFVQLIKERHPSVEFFMNDVSSTYGGYLLAKNELSNRDEN